MSLRRTRVYIAGPLYSSGNVQENINKVVRVGLELAQLGYAPLMPHLTHYVDPYNSSVSPSNWYEIDLAWVATSDVLLRLPGKSVGADKEVEAALAIPIPVYHSLRDLLNSEPTLRIEGEYDRTFENVLKELKELHNKKQQDYGRDKDPLFNLRASAQFGIEPWVGTMVRAGDKLHRIAKFVSSGNLLNEGVEDSLRDLAVYAILALQLYREKERDKKYDQIIVSSNDMAPYQFDESEVRIPESDRHIPYFEEDYQEEDYQEEPEDSLYIKEKGEE